MTEKPAFNPFPPLCIAPDKPYSCQIAKCPRRQIATHPYEKPQAICTHPDAGSKKGYDEFCIPLQKDPSLLGIINNKHED